MKRRNLLLTLPAITMASTYSSLVKAAPKTIRLVDTGGSTGESIEAAYVRPFTQKTGVKVIREAPASLGKLRAMVESGRTTASIFELGSSTMAQAKELNLLEQLDWEAIDPKPMFSDARDDYGMGYQYFSTVMSWRAGQAAPQNWADFFDVQKFPGRRCLSSFPHYTLQFALLADGVDIDSLFPLDVDRAMRKLESIKKHVSVWWKAGTQPIQLLKDNEVQYAISWSASLGREPEIQSSFNQGMYDIAWLTVPRGQDSQQKLLAMKFLHEVSLAENQKVAVDILPLSGNSTELEALVGKEEFKSFPTSADNLKIQFRQNSEWWQKNGAEVNKIWSQFLLNA